MGLIELGAFPSVLYLLGIHETLVDNGRVYAHLFGLEIEMFG